MTAFGLMLRDDGDASLVIRRDESDGDHESVLTLPRSIADEIDRRGMAIRQQDSIRGIGHPGVVTIASLEGDSVIEVRADVADPTTVVATGRLDTAATDVCVGCEPAVLRWIVDPNP